MDFQVVFNDYDTKSYTGNSRYEIHDFGVLVITDENGHRLHLSPHGWLSVSDQEPKGGHARMTPSA